MIATIANLAPAETEEIHLHITCRICGCERISTVSQKAWLHISDEKREFIRTYPCEACEEN